MGTASCGSCQGAGIYRAVFKCRHGARHIKKQDSAWGFAETDSEVSFAASGLWAPAFRYELPSVFHHTVLFGAGIMLFFTAFIRQDPCPLGFTSNLDNS